MTDRQLVANRLLCSDGVIIQSFHRHDYKTHTDPSTGDEFMVDGGLDYVRRSVKGECACVYTDDDHNYIREVFCWGTYGKKGDQPLHRVAVQNMSNAHIEAILSDHERIGNLRGYIKKIFEDELLYRKDNFLFIED